MPNITIEINSQQVDAMLSSLIRQGTNLTPALGEIGHSMVGLIDLLFINTETPDGAQWPELSPVTKKRRRDGSEKPLNDTGILKNSITSNVLNGASVEAGSNIKYAAMQNYGGKKSAFPHLWGDIPARQFLPTSQLPEAWGNDVIGIINRHIQRGLG
ncbi:phage virion morphogenesis protein [Crenothrix polyspora]|uniref:Putative Phage virion morphogenesis protein n=1 Tax=Crenothrix polyspora TaxID=360316 RepID=A0A1R4HIM5_9GAMM|nr:phage virion morphogenesis protein [Crenothrix polyspora]SJM96049.1 putative Phage virion morphogenesis protein [Crenothrix polyspora]